MRIGKWLGIAASTLALSGCSMDLSASNSGIATGVLMIVLGCALVLYVALTDYDELTIEDDEAEAPAGERLVQALLAGILLIVIGIGVLAVQMLAWVLF